MTCHLRPLSSRAQTRALQHIAHDAHKGVFDTSLFEFLRVLTTPELWPCGANGPAAMQLATSLLLQLCQPNCSWYPRRVWSLLSEMTQPPDSLSLADGSPRAQRSRAVYRRPPSAESSGRAPPVVGRRRVLPRRRQRSSIRRRADSRHAAMCTAHPSCPWTHTNPRDDAVPTRIANSTRRRSSAFRAESSRDACSRPPSCSHGAPRRAARQRRARLVAPCQRARHSQR